MNSPARSAIDDDAAYRALLERDARLDGRLFVGVTSTGVYCRPICRVRTPRRENCRFFDTPAQAEAEAFRPCLKCRPEIAPGPGLAWSVMDASRTLARQAGHWLDAHAHACEDAESARVAALARHLGVSDRHLRRIFGAEHGVTPLQYVQTRRLLLAKQLLTDTSMPISQVAHASGFRSLRRFNAAFAGNYRLSPSRLRRETAGAPSAQRADVNVALAFREPFARDEFLRFLAQRAIPDVEAVDVDALSIRRTVRAGVITEAGGWIEARFAPQQPLLRLRCSASLAVASGTLLPAVRRWFDLDADPQAMAAALQPLPGSAGLRLAGGLDAFELAVRAVLGQQVTVAVARTLAGRLVRRFGTPIATPWPDLAYGFAAPAALAGAEVSAVAELGIVRTRATAVIALAQTWPELRSLLQPNAQAAPLIERLCGMPGIGPWTAHYIAMRALGWSDAFPPGDVAVLNALGLPRAPFAQREAEARSQAWRPWRSYAVLALWNSLAPAASAPAPARRTHPDVRSAIDPETRP
jgi:AraC family transcriptional regulator of adaptative response / DNA-3-methyladenine glycosylase II